ncbi:MAG: hypothetical protein AAF752_05035 [Bacteroidota bacterium]
MLRRYLLSSCLILCAAGLASAQSVERQSRAGELRISPFVGYCFAPESQQDCLIYGASVKAFRYRDGSQLRGRQDRNQFFQTFGSTGAKADRRRGVGAGVTALWTGNVWPPPADYPTAQLEALGKAAVPTDDSDETLDHGPTLVLTGEVYLSFGRPAFRLEPFIGGGIARTSPGDPTAQIAALGENQVPVFVYGPNIPIGKGSVYARIEYRGLFFVAGDIEYDIPGGILTEDVGTIHEAAGLVGVGFRL